MPRIAVAQISSSTKKQENAALACELIKKAKSELADVIAFPEFLMAYSPVEQTAEQLCALAETVDGPFTAALQNTARECQVEVLATIYEECGVPNRVYDTALWIDRSGAIVSVYRKLHLYDALGFKESDKFYPGADLAPPAKTDFAQAGIMICYDLRFPELSRLLALMGAEILFAPSGWVEGELKIEHWQTMIRARAVENGCYVIAPDQIGNIYIGRSMAVDPYGRILLEMNEDQGLQMVDVDLAIVGEVREKLPLLQNRRADVYANYAQTLLRKSL